MRWAGRVSSGSGYCHFVLGRSKQVLYNTNRNEFGDIRRPKVNKRKNLCRAQNPKRLRPVSEPSFGSPGPPLNICKHGSLKIVALGQKNSASAIESAGLVLVIGSRLCSSLYEPMAIEVAKMVARR